MAARVLRLDARQVRHTFSYAAQQASGIGFWTRDSEHVEKAFDFGGMGARSRNFHMELMSRMGFEAEAKMIQDLFFEGRRDEAIPLVPTQFADEISLVGPKERIRDRLAAWNDSPVTTIIVNGDFDTLRTIAELAG